MPRKLKSFVPLAGWRVLAICAFALSACAQPTAAPTIAPTAVPPTAVPITATPAPTLAPSTATPAPDRLAQVAAFEAAFDQHDIDGVMALFVEDPHWGLLLGPLTGFQSVVSQLALRNTLEFQYEFNTEMDATDCTAKNDKVSCILVIKDDCTPASIDAYHFHTQFTFTAGKLASVSGRWDSSDEQAFMATDAARLTWARDNLPADAAVYSSMVLELDGGNSGEWTKFSGSGEQGPGTLTAAEFGQVVERICAGYTLASQ